MNSIYDAVSLSKRKTVSIFILILLISLMIFYFEVLDYHESLLLSMKISGVLLSFILTWIIMDMTHPFESMIRSYRGRMYLYFHKFLQVLTWSFLLSITIMIILLTSVLLNGHDIVFSYFIMLSIHLLLDLIIIGFLVIMSSMFKHPTLSLLMPLIYTTYQLFTDQMESLFLYTIIPFFQPVILNYNLAISYKLCYIGIGLLITNFPRKNQ